MTPIKDSAWKDRQWIIHGPDAPVQMYRRLIKDGYSEHAAQTLSGHHPLDEWDAFFKRFAWFMIVGCSAILLALYANASTANMDIPDYKRTEAALVTCLNGGTIRFDNGDEFMCFKMR
jgi:hypothetical protein